MKIAHIVRRFSFEEWGGTESVVWNIAKQQKAQGLFPEILCTSALNKVGFEEVEGIPIKRFPYFYPYFPMPRKDKLTLDKKGGNPFSIKLINELKNNNYDIFHIHAGARLANCVIKLSKKTKTPTLLSLHGGSCAIPQQEMQLMLQPLKHKFSYGGIIDRLLNIRVAPESKADVLLALSKEEVSKLKALYPNKQIELFPNGILHRNLPLEDNFKCKYNINKDAKLVTCISRIDYQKNQKILLHILEKNPDTIVLLIGPVTSQWYLEEILNEAKKLNVQERLVIIPGLEPNNIELLEALKNSYCFILPSRHEPFGIAALEALDAQVPLIASNVGGLNDFLVDKQNALIFMDNDENSLLQAFESLPKYREEIILGGTQTAIQYNWETIAARLKDIYTNLL